MEEIRIKIVDIINLQNNLNINTSGEKWTMPIRNWSLTISQLNIHFKERLQNALNLV